MFFGLKIWYTELSAASPAAEVSETAAAVEFIYNKYQGPFRRMTVLRITALKA